MKQYQFDSVHQIKRVLIKKFYKRKKRNRRSLASRLIVQSPHSGKYCLTSVNQRRIILHAMNHYTRNWNAWLNDRWSLYYRYDPILRFLLNRYIILICLTKLKILHFIRNLHFIRKIYNNKISSNILSKIVFIIFVMSSLGRTN